MANKNGSDKIKKEADDFLRRQRKRTEIMGYDGRVQQDKRLSDMTEYSGLYRNKTPTDKEKTTEAIKRVGEYKKAAKKMAKGGKTTCRGMGKATRGGNFRNC